VMPSGIISAISVMMARYVAYFVPLSENGIRAVAIAGILLLSLINYLGIKPGSTVQLVLTTAKLGAIAVMLVLLFGFGGAAHRALPAIVDTPSIPLSAYGLAVAGGLFAFGGWHMGSSAARRTLDPARTLPPPLPFPT